LLITAPLIAGPLIAGTLIAGARHEAQQLVA